VTVTSQVALRLSRHWIDVNPSGRFPSDWSTLVVPRRMECQPGMVNERQIKSFS